MIWISEAAERLRSRHSAASAPAAACLEHGHGIVEIVGVGRGEVEGDVALSAVIELEHARVGNVGDLLEDLFFDLPLRHGAALDLHLRHELADKRHAAGDVVDELLQKRMLDLLQIDVDGGAAALEVALRRGAAENEMFSIVGRS